jgi:hypothetical protein
MTRRAKHRRRRRSMINKTRISWLMGTGEFRVVTTPSANHHRRRPGVRGRYEQTNRTRSAGTRRCVSAVRFSPDAIIIIKFWTKIWNICVRTTLCAITVLRAHNIDINRYAQVRLFFFFLHDRTNAYFCKHFSSVQYGDGYVMTFRLFRDE